MNQKPLNNQFTNTSIEQLRKQTRLLWWAVVLTFIFIASLVTLILARWPYAATHETPYVLANTSLAYQSGMVRPPLKPIVRGENHVPFKRNTDWQTVRVKAGDTLSAIFEEIGLDPQTLEDVTKLKKNSWTSLRPGQEISFKIDEQNELQGLSFRVSQRENLVVKRVGDEYQAVLEKIIPKRELKHVRLFIQHSLYQAAKKAAIDDKIILEMIEVFNWDIDFTRDIQPGDELEILFEAFNIDNKPAGVGDLLYVKIKNRGKVHEALRYTDPKGHSSYFSPNGQSLRKAFLRTPVKFSHISSYFNLSRMHPILHKIRAHKGVDYAAPRGTPVKSAGDGIVIFTGRKNGYGNVIIVKHSDLYETLYAHLDHFAGAIRPGRAVDQGDIIGYVGATGLATAPHLHYEFHIHGVQTNPLSAKLPQSLPIASRYKSDFKKKASVILAALHPHISTSNKKI
jgi:murein DD-endopeptidase MepM/ murein hydrolase activator NlpD